MKEAPIRLQTQLGLNSLTAHLEPPPKRMRLRSLRLALGAAIWAVLSLAGASRALATLPTLLVFLVLQRFIVRGVMLAGLKG